MGLMPGKGPGQMSVITFTVNAQAYVELLDTFLNPLVERMFGDVEFILQDDSASSHRAKSIQTFLQERRINSKTWAANSLVPNPIQYLWYNYKNNGSLQGSIMQS